MLDTPAKFLDAMYEKYQWEFFRWEKLFCDYL